MAIPANLRREVVAEAERRATQTLRAMYSIQGQNSVTDGYLREQVMSIIPRIKWNLTPNPIYSHWEVYNLTDDQVQNPFVQALGTVEEVPSLAVGRYHRIHPTQAPADFYAEPEGFKQLRTPEQQAVWDAYWKAYGCCQNGSDADFNEAAAKLLEALESLSARNGQCGSAK